MSGVPVEQLSTERLVRALNKEGDRAADAGAGHPAMLMWEAADRLGVAERRVTALYEAIVKRCKTYAREYDDGEHEWRAYLTEAEADAIAMVEGEEEA